MDTDKSKNRCYNIVGGPNKDTIFDACKYAYSKSSHIDVYFSVVTGYTAPPETPGCAHVLMDLSDIVIAGVEHEDGTGDKLNLHGYCNVNENGFLNTTGCLARCPYKFTAYYNTRERKGTINFYR